MKKTKRKALHRQLAPANLRVMAEYSSSGIWLVQPIGVFRHGMLDHNALGLPRELAERFTQWIAQYEQKLFAPGEFDVVTSNAEGRLLAQALKHHVGNRHSVEFLAETVEGGLCLPEEILV